MSPWRLPKTTAAAILLVATAASAQQPAFAELRRMFPWDDADSQAVLLRDLDGDGAPDAVIGAIGQDRLYLNDGFGLFTDATANLPQARDDTFSLAAGDVDGDGDTDLVFGNGGSARLVLDVGATVYVDSPVPLPPLAGGARSIALGDLDLDGDLDALVGSHQSGGPILRVWLNDGTGVFSDVTATNVANPFPGTSVAAIALGDLDGDGDLDAYAGVSGGQNRLLVNAGGVLFDGSSVLPPTGDDTTGVALADLDGNGALDVVVANKGVTAFLSYTLRNAGPGGFSGPYPFPTGFPPSLDPICVAAADLDQDGDQDVLVTLAGLKTVLVNDGAGGLSPAGNPFPPSSASDSANAVAVGDVDGDSDPDVVVACPGQDRLYLGDGAGAFGNAALPAPAPAGAAHDVVLRDFDGDGDLDAFLAVAGHDELWTNDGSGRFFDAPGQVPAVGTPSAPLGAGSLRAAAGDLDGNGSADVFTGGPGGNLLYLNDGSGNLSNATGQVPWSAGTRSAVALSDVDGDGDLDAFTVGVFASGPRTALFLNDGAAAFSVAALPLPQPDPAASALAAGDLDGDGDADLYRAINGQDEVWVNLGGGAFAAAAPSTLPSESAHGADVALGDVDADGDLDVLVGCLDAPASLLINDGSGAFVASTQIPVGPAGTWDVKLADADHDGDLDALFCNVAWPQSAIGVPNALWLNDGSGAFTPAAGVPPAHGWASGIGDLDGDGDVDWLVLDGAADARLFYDASRQLSWRAMPRIGKPLALDVRGPANGAWCLAASAAGAGAPQSLGPLGVLRLDPSAAAVIGAGAFDASGRATIVIAIPNVPALAGPPIGVQALAGFPLLLTNLEIVALAAY
jgi:hypothetical protein